ncbi:MAG: IS30 family transposase [Dysgonamonadaceae bacterium]|nr:IS30 family transposase [Dysgonamonadaceae bacterium]
MTSDNGCEFYEHKQIAKRLNTEYFFAHPYSSWERGLNEYTNGLVRQYVPKKQKFTDIDDKIIRLFQNKINRRPRKFLNLAAGNHTLRIVTRYAGGDLLRKLFFTSRS